MLEIVIDCDKCGAECINPLYLLFISESYFRLIYGYKASAASIPIPTEWNLQCLGNDN